MLQKEMNFGSIIIVMSEICSKSGDFAQRDTQFSASDRDIITEKFDGIRRNNAAKDFRQQREIRDLKSEKKPSILDIYKKSKDNLRARQCY